MTGVGHGRLSLRYLVIFTTGVFGLAAQSLLFRDFFTIFEGHEIGIGSFFGSWLIWVAAGALLGRSRSPFVNRLARHFGLLALLYLPAYLAQAALISAARSLAGIAAYELFPLARMLPMSFLVNAPVSLCTGFLFCLACRWVTGSCGGKAVLRGRAENRLGRASPSKRIGNPLEGEPRVSRFPQQEPWAPVSRVYLAEAAGGAAGGIGVTLLLGAGWTGPGIALAAASLVLFGVALEAASRRALATAALACLAVYAAWGLRVDEAWARRRALHNWSRILPSESYLGSFSTAQAQYRYGMHRGQFNVMAWNGVTEALPRLEYASEIVAIHLAQHPEARRFLVVGPGSLAICRRLLDLPQAETVTWLDPDPAYPRRLTEILPDALAGGVEQIEMPGIDVRTFLRDRPGAYDLIILNLPDATTLALNRYFTREFFTLARAGLSPGGVLGVRTQAGENFMGDELVNVGASVHRTLSLVFPKLKLRPGDETWIFAGPEGRLSSRPAELRDRFRSVAGAATIYPPEGLMSQYLPDRIVYQEAYYREAAARDRTGMLINTDRRPRALLHSLLFAARQAGARAGLAARLHTFAVHGAPVLPFAVLLAVLLRVVYVTRNGTGRGPAPRQPMKRRPGVPAFDLVTLVWTTGCAGMGLSLVLMYWYQALFGSIFLFIGLFSALFMAGLVGVGLLCQHLLTRHARWAVPLLLTGLVLQAGGMVALTFVMEGLTVFQFAALFLLGGMLSGGYVPAVAALLSASGRAVEQDASSIELGDHLGGAFGGLVVGLILLPVFGAAYTLHFLALLLLITPLSWLPSLRPSRVRRTRDRFDALARPLGYTLFGIAALALSVSLLMHHAGRPSTWSLFMEASRAMSEGGTTGEERRGTDDLGDYRYLAEGEGPDAFFHFSDLGLCDAGVGFGGPVSLAAKTDARGHLQAFRVLKSNETPAYLDRIEAWAKDLVGQNVFGSDALSEVDGVTGATLTSAAILETLGAAGRSFATGILGYPGDTEAPAGTVAGPNRRAIALLALAAVALALRARPSPAGRNVLLIIAVLVTGWLLNVQYSLAQVFSLLGLRPPPLGVSAAFLLVVGLPILTLLFGNLYCGYLCPFGALQELMAKLRPANLDMHPGAMARRFGRQLKYWVLFCCVLAFACTLDPALASVDPLVTVFSSERSRTLLALIALILFVSVFHNRFWCRNLCPTGAFLALLNGPGLLRRFRPRIYPPACSFGVRDPRDMDCLCCDRCRAFRGRDRRRLSALQGRKPGKWPTILFAAALLSALLLLGRYTGESYQRHQAARTLGVAGVAGKAREADLRRLKWLMEQGRLSDREALFYRDWNPEDRPSSP